MTSPALGAVMLLALLPAKLLPLGLIAAGSAALGRRLLDRVVCQPRRKATDRRRHETDRPRVGAARAGAGGTRAGRRVPGARARWPRSAAHQRIAWYERGSGPPLLLAIGTGSTMAEWDPALLCAARARAPADPVRLSRPRPLLAAAGRRAHLVRRPRRHDRRPAGARSASSAPTCSAGRWAASSRSSSRSAIPPECGGWCSPAPTPAATARSSARRPTSGSTATPIPPTPPCCASSTRARAPARPRAAPSSRGWSAPARPARSPTTSTSRPQPSTARSRPRIRGCARTRTRGRCGGCGCRCSSPPAAPTPSRRRSTPVASRAWCRARGWPCCPARTPSCSASASRSPDPVDEFLG